MLTTLFTKHATSLLLLTFIPYVTLDSRVPPAKSTLQIYRGSVAPLPSPAPLPRETPTFTPPPLFDFRPFTQFTNSIRLHLDNIYMKTILQSILYYLILVILFTIFIIITTNLHKLNTISIG